ncbi:ABC transporter permease YtrF [Flavobacteriales bacterium]|nr:ABC transporter permease YtrF [Flavobacteriales bacterium]
MITKIAWKNIWRNKLRSSVLIFSISLGIWAGLFLMSMTTGLNTQRISNAIHSGLAHVQIHHPEYIKENNPKYFINDTTKIYKSLKNTKHVVSWSAHSNYTGMAASPTGGFGVQITGINPKREQNTTIISKRITQGSYFKSEKKNQVVIGEKLAKKLKVQLNNKIVLTIQDTANNIISGSFKIVGIFKTASSRFDESSVFVNRKDIEMLTGNNALINEIIVIADDIENVMAITHSLLISNPKIKVRTWDEISPELGYANELMTIGLSVFILIIILAMSFGIINTMLMAVLERKRELGMLLSVGMNKQKVFSMILGETLFISLIGGPSGIIGAWLTIIHFSKKGIDLSSMGKGLDSLGIGSVIYTKLDYSMYFIIAIIVILTAVLASVYPSLRALRMNPAEVVRQN